MKRHSGQNDLMAPKRRKLPIQWSYPLEDRGSGVVIGKLFLYRAGHEKLVFARNSLNIHCIAKLKALYEVQKLILPTRAPF